MNLGYSSIFFDSNLIQSSSDNSTTVTTPLLMITHFKKRQVKNLGTFSNNRFLSHWSKYDMLILKLASLILPFKNDCSDSKSGEIPQLSPHYLYIRKFVDFIPEMASSKSLVWFATFRRYRLFLYLHNLEIWLHSNRLKYHKKLLVYDSICHSV